jgi:hypothetical protein
MKIKIYLFLIVILLFLSVGLIIVYYNQEFTEDLVISKSIKSADINLRMETRYSSEENYLAEATVDIGRLTLTNKGYFEQKYVLPNLIGCIYLTPGNPGSSTSVPFNIEFSDGVTTMYNPLTVYTNQSKILTVKARYTGRYSAELKSFDNINEIQIYSLPEDNENPIKDLGYNDYRYNYDQCNNLKANEKPLQTIILE